MSSVTRTPSWPVIARRTTEPAPSAAISGASGCVTTLRGDRMYEFLDRLVTITLPRIRDFRGINGRSFDGRGNYAMGIKEHIVFPEISYDKVDKIRGLDIVICTSAKTDDEAKELLTAFKMPFRK